MSRSHSRLFDSTNTPTVVGHRGSGTGIRLTHRGWVRENTTESMLSAWEAGAQWVECDVVRTKDDVLILSHNTKTADDIAFSDISAQQAIESGYEPLSKLFETLPIECGILVEVKHTDADLDFDRISTVDLVKDALVEERAKTGRALLSYGFDMSVAVILDRDDRLENSGIAVGIIGNSRNDPVGLLLAGTRLDVSVVAFHVSTLLGTDGSGGLTLEKLTQLVHTAHKHGLEILVWGVEPEHVPALAKTGIDAIAVDDIGSTQQQLTTITKMNTSYDDSRLVQEKTNIVIRTRQDAPYGPRPFIWEVHDVDCRPIQDETGYGWDTLSGKAPDVASAIAYAQAASDYIALRSEPPFPDRAVRSALAQRKNDRSDQLHQDNTLPRL